MRSCVTYYSIVAMFILVSCRKELASDSHSSVVHISTSIEESPVHTKVPITETGFLIGSQNHYGIFICKHGSTSIAHKANAWNIKAMYEDYDNPHWNYYYSHGYGLSQTPYDNITISERDDHATADIYAYAPYSKATEGTTGPTSIAYSILPDQYGITYDLMYAVENLSTCSDVTPDSQDGNEDLDPASTDPVNATFTFHHAYALLKFNFRLLNARTVYYVQNVTIDLNDPDEDGTTTAKLFTSGTFDATTGCFHSGAEEATSITLPVGVGVSSSYPNSGNVVDPAVGYIMLVPTQVADNELSFRFNVNGQVLPPFYLQKSHLLHTGSPETYGFLSGYMYTFNFTLDNYVYLDGITISPGWTVAELGNEEI